MYLQIALHFLTLHIFTIFYIRIRIEFGTYSMYESIGNGFQFKNLLNFNL